MPRKCKKSFSEIENDSNDTLVLDDDAHKVNLHTCSSFFLYEVGIPEFTSHNKSRKLSNIRNLLRKKEKS